MTPEAVTNSLNDYYSISALESTNKEISQILKETNYNHNSNNETFNTSNNVNEREKEVKPKVRFVQLFCKRIIRNCRYNNNLIERFFIALVGNQAKRFSLLHQFTINRHSCFE